MLIGRLARHYLLTVPNVRDHPSTAQVPVSYYLSIITAIYMDSCISQTVQNKPVGFMPDCAPSSERSQYRMPPSFDRYTLPRRRFNQNIPPTVMLLQQCHCRNRHRGRLQNLSPPSVLFKSSRIFFTIHRRHRRKK